MARKESRTEEVDRVGKKLRRSKERVAKLQRQFRDELTKEGKLLGRYRAALFNHRPEDDGNEQT